ncbi:MAG: putative acetolactate synthase large subunit [Promethearchaeota archaeon]|nr:MAG: putative acetolactate synthase large subunit [Candidatus Lokiarchaeota archaeon]
MVKQNGAQLIIRALSNQGVNVLFTLCGDNDLLYNYCNDKACVETGIDIIDFRHEQATGHAAMGYYLATGKPGVCSVQSGPGITDLFPSIPIAYDCSIPLISINTSTAMMEFEKLAMNEIDVAPSFRPVTKWTGYCYETARLPEYVNMAFRIATTGRPGPVMLLVPFDVIVSECDDELEIIQHAFQPVDMLRATHRPYGNEELVEKAVDMLLRAERPLIIAGTGAGFSDAQNQLVKFAELTKIPVGVWGFGNGSFPPDHPLYFGLANPMDGPGTSLMQKVDVALILGARLTALFNFGYMPCFSEEAKLVQVDIEAEELGRNRGIDVPIVGDVSNVVKQMIRVCEEKLDTPPSEKPWNETVRAELSKFYERVEKEGSSDKIPIRPQRLVKEIADFMPKDGYIILDGGDTTVWGLTMLKSYFPKSVYFSGGLGIQHLGGGVPMAIATKYAHPDKKVLVLTGDGSFLFNGKELDSARRLDLPFVVVISNDRLWGMVARGQKIAHGRKYFGLGSSLSDKTRYDKYAEAFDCHGTLVKDPSEIRPALKRAFESGIPAVIDVRINPKVNTVMDYLAGGAYNPAQWKREVPKKSEKVVDVSTFKE